MSQVAEVEELLEHEELAGRFLNPPRPGREFALTRSRPW
jgi:hypothetical protein